MRRGLIFLNFYYLLGADDGSSAGPADKITKYGCENTTLSIQCAAGTAIKILRANFGRFSISVCNDFGNTTWSVNCMEPRTLRVINAR